MNNRLSSIIFLSVFSFALLNSCQSIPKNEKAGWLSDFLSGLSCQLPCWDGIVPGSTTIEEAYKIISSSPENHDVTYNKPTELSNHSNLYWSKLQGNGKPYPHGVITTAVGDEIVSEIDIILHNGGKDTWLYLGEVIETYEDPEYVFNYHTPNGCAFGVVFPDQGMVALIGMVSYGFTINIRERSSIDFLLFLSEEAIQEPNYGLEETLSLIEPWAGYARFKCK